jgi:hypothetical protein
MHAMQTRIGALLVVTGFTLAFALGAGWAVVVGAALLVVGGIVLAIAVEPMLRFDEQTTPADDGAEAAERRAA